MKKVLTILLITIFVVGCIFISETSWAKSSRNILKEGLLGAGTGAASSAISGGNAGTGALVGAGVSVIGGALLDTLTGGGEERAPRNTYQEPTYRQPAAPRYSSPQTAYSDGYEAGYANGYKKGYTEGYKEGLKEAYRSSR